MNSQSCFYPNSRRWAKAHAAGTSKKIKASYTGLIWRRVECSIKETPDPVICNHFEDPLPPLQHFGTLEKFRGLQIKVCEFCWGPSLKNSERQKMGMFVRTAWFRRYKWKVIAFWAPSAKSWVFTIWRRTDFKSTNRSSRILNSQMLIRLPSNMMLYQRHGWKTLFVLPACIAR